MPRDEAREHPGHHTPEEFDAMYGGTPPWDIGRPQPAFVALAEAGGIAGRVLDVGCGTGEHALMAAGFGFDATGVDSSPTAIARAETKARERGIAARFFVWNALQLAALGEQLDTVLDSGLFHVFSDADRRSFVEGLAAIVRAGGRYFLMCFSDRQPGQCGPRRITQDEIRSAFAGGWRIDSIDPAEFEVLIPPGTAQAWLARITRA